MSQTLEQQVQLLMDKWEIEKVLARYCRAIDRTDMELLKSVYHPDGIDNHGVFTGNAMEFAEFIIPQLKAVVLDGMHTVTHSLIEIDGNFAISESYYWAYQLTPGGAESVIPYFGEVYAAKMAASGEIDRPHDYYCGGRYIDLFEKRDGEWKILNRTITNEWNDIRPSYRLREEGAMVPLNLPGRRDGQDPVFLNKLPGRVAEPAE